jgi:hypothetical protein
MSLSIPRSATIVASSDLLSSEFGSELVLLNLKDGVYYGLDELGLEIWRLIQKPISLAAIVEEVVSGYDVEPARCEGDLRALLDDLAKRGLIEIRT